MSLIKCPECEKEISDKADVCPNCGYPLKDTKINNTICKINQQSYNLEKALCLCLNGKYKESFIEISNQTKLSIKNCLNILEQIKMLECIPDDYKVKEYTKEEEKEATIIIFSMKDKKLINNNNREVSCPKCGSTQIQVVPRKWSLLAGFATKKVDRVCVSCKYRW